MKSFVALFVVVAVVAADVSHIVHNPDQDAVIVKQSADVLPDGFNYEYETSNGISGQEVGVLENQGTENEGISVQGSNSYTAPDGTVIRLSWRGDANGFQPQGDHLPTPPAPQPIPDYILRSLDYIAAHPPKPESGLRA